jgi:F0F1-type ATP synthase assembly protein I
MSALDRKLDWRMSLSTLGWLFTLGVLAHNTEEMVSLPAWAARNVRWRVRVGNGAFRFAAAVQSLILVVLASAAFSSEPQSIFAYLFAGFVFAMVVNVFAPHVFASLALRKYMPGTATALLLNLPLGVLFLQRALGEGFVAWDTLVWAAPATALLVLLSIPVLFFLGRHASHLR